jgi:hypothetical protein
MGDIFLLTFPFIERRYRQSGFPGLPDGGTSPKSPLHDRLSEIARRPEHLVRMKQRMIGLGPAVKEFLIAASLFRCWRCTELGRSAILIPLV